MNRRCESCACDNPAEAAFCRQCGRPAAEPLLRSTTRLSALLAQWRKLSQKLTRNEVRKLLGEPKRIACAAAGAGDAESTTGNIAAPSLEIWTYEYQSISDWRRIHGDVRISPAESRVLAWTEPDWDELCETP